MCAGLFGGDSSEYLSNPRALDTICYAFASAVFEVGTHTKGKERFDNLSLRTDRRWRARSTSSSVLHREVKRGGPGLILDHRITSGPQKRFHGRSAPCSDGAVQRSRAVHVLQMNVGPFVKEAMDRLYLSFRIPCGTRDEPIRRVMQRAASATIPCRVRIGACGQQ